MIEIYKRENGKTIDISHMSRTTLFKLIYQPIVIPYQLCYSKILKEALDYYKNVPLTNHKLTTREKNLIERDPSYKQNIPEWEIAGYDSFVSDVRLDGRIREEFYRRFITGDNDVIEAINNYHPTIKARYR